MLLGIIKNVIFITFIYIIKINIKNKAYHISLFLDDDIFYFLLIVT